MGGLSRAGLAGSAIYLVLSALWLWLGRPPGSRLVYEVWFIALVVAGSRLPGPADQVTLARAYLAAPALVYASSASTLGLLAVTVAVAGLTDLVDGTVARRFSAPTRLGGALDPVVDGVFFGAVAAGLAAGGTYPWWLAAVVIARYAAPAAAGAVLLLMERRPTLTHTLLGQLSTAVIAVLLGGLALLRGLGQPTGAVITVAEVAVPLVAALAIGQLAWENRSALGPHG